MFAHRLVFEATPASVLMDVANSINTLAVTCDLNPVVALLPQVVAQVAAKLRRTSEDFVRNTPFEETHGKCQRHIGIRQQHQMHMGRHDRPYAHGSA